MAVAFVLVLAAYAAGAWAGYDSGWRYGRRALRRELEHGADIDEIIDAERRG